MELLALLTVMVGQVSSNPSVDAIDDDEVIKILRTESSSYQDRPGLLFHFSSEYNLAEGTEGPDASLGERRSGDIRWDRDRVESIVTDTYYEPSSEWADDDGFRPTRQEHRVWKNGRALGLREFVNPAFDKHEQPFTTQAKLHDAVRPDMYGWFLDGVIVDSEYFADLLLRASELKGVVDRTETGEALLQVSGTTSKGSMTVWLDSESPHLLRRARFEADPGYVSTLSGIDEAAIEVSVTEYIDVDGVLLAKAGSAVYSYTVDTTGEHLKKKISTNRFGYSIQPEFAGLNAFQIDFPDNTIVYNYDASNSRFVWIQGELHPYVE